MMINTITDKIINGGSVTYTEAKHLLGCDINLLTKGADTIKNKFCGNKVSLCSIINGKSGCCSEDCKFCAQSAHYNTSTDNYNFLPLNTIKNDCINHDNAGVDRYSIVTSGKALSGNDFESEVSIFEALSVQCTNIKLCASNGLLSLEQLKKLKNAGVTRYHCNIETSKERFSEVCTTHSFEDKIKTIRNAQSVGLEVCSGGIIGIGESFEDRLSMAFTLNELNVDSIPINILLPIKNTPYENIPPLSEEEIIRTIAIFRYINPKADIRIAGGRSKISDNGLRAFFAGANATITGDYLTTTGSTIISDREMFINNGFSIKEI